MPLPIAMFNGPELWLIVALVVLVLFGGKKIPELMRGVGQGVGELKKGLEEGQRQMRDAVHHDTTPPPAAPVTPPTTTPPANQNTTPVP